MGAIRGSSVDPARIQAEVDRLASSSVLHGAETLCRLLRFLVQQRLEHPETPIKEYEIATRLLGRPTDFDPRIDPVVRVQMGRLRSKIVEYYATEGSDSNLRLTVPKGGYAPDFVPRPRMSPNGATDAAPDAAGWTEGQGLKSIPAERRRSRRAWLGVAGVSALAVFGVGWVLGVQSQAAKNPPQPAPRDPPATAKEPNEPLARLWSPFATAGRPVLVVVGNSPVADRAGIGEVFAVSNVQRLLSSMNAELHLKRGQLLNWDDAQNRPVIFIGPPSDKLRLGDLPRQQKFVIQQREQGWRQGLVIRNTSPGPGEPAEFQSETPRPARADYGLIIRTVGFDGISPILILTGTTALGTEAAVDFASDGHRVSDLARKLGGALPAAFSALLIVEIEGGVPVHARLVDAAPARTTDE